MDDIRMMHQLGIDVGGTSVKMALLSNGATVWTGRSKNYDRPDGSRLMTALREAADGRVERIRIDACGICVPGILNESRDTVLLSVNVPGLNNLPIASLVREALGDSISKIKICNDAISCATDVVHALQLSGRVMVLAMGTGVGCAVLDVEENLSSIKPLLVEGESPGHIGMVDVTCDDPPTIGADGGAGSLEGYCGIPALIARYGSVERAINEMKPTDPPMKALARIIRIGHAIYRPHHVVLGGGVGVQLSKRLDEIRKLVDANLTTVARSDRTVRCAIDIFHGARGAGRLAR
ncbi:MAG TPA: ROK family protein [Tepidisphaeraceae bacterium]|nr:ROK family protein [Tepidisphaeraceae bacterium]